MMHILKSVIPFVYGLCLFGFITKETKFSAHFLTINISFRIEVVSLWLYTVCILYNQQFYSSTDCVCLGI